MAIHVEKTGIPGVRTCVPDIYPDSRGFFQETYQRERYEEAGIPGPFVQDNHSCSAHGVLRGMHFQIEQAQAKLVSVLCGEIYDVVIDTRKGSPAFGKWEAHRLSRENRKQLYIPRGLAHGFCVLSKQADVVYKCSEVYYPAGERGLLWCDPDIGIEWPLKEPLLSERDTEHPCLRDIPEDELAVYEV